MYGFYFNFGLLAAANQLNDFKLEAVKVFLSNIIEIAFFFVPIIILLKFEDKVKIEFKQIEIKKYYILICIVLTTLFAFIYIPENIQTDLSIINNGVIGTFIDDFKNKKEVELVTTINDTNNNKIAEEIIEEESVPLPQVLDIDFDSFEESNQTYKKLNDYFKDAKPTYTNEYTGIFKDKNLILILGETFNKVGVSKDLTPTLYKMINDGFKFTNYYSSSYNSTVGGEFQLLNGMYAQSSALGIWKAGTNYFPYGVGNVFSKIGYSVNAYHDHAYDYMERNSYLKSVGLGNYLGCYNGLEKRMTCGRYFDLDSEMPEATMSDYINNEKFFAYYVTISGHGPYNYSTTVGPLHRQEIIDKGYNYSEKYTAYISGMIELDKMLENMINILEKENKLDDTVFVVVGDHYPYYFDVAELNQITGEQLDEIVDVCRNDLIIYNSQTEQAVCDKVGNTMDVLATIYNLFGVEYDSRLIIGKDLFSDAPGFAYFGNGAWVSDYGTYYAHLGTFVQRQDKQLPDNYLENAHAYARSQMAMTSLIFNSNYYKYLFDKLDN